MFTARHMLAALAIPIAFAFARELRADAFTYGSIVVCRVGDGATPVLNAASPVFLDERSPTTGALIQSIAMPVAVSGANKRLTEIWGATQGGMLTLTQNGQYLVLTGYDTDVGTVNVVLTTSAAVNRVIGRVDGAGSVDTSTAFVAWFNQRAIRGAASDSGVDLWAVGSDHGVLYTVFGNAGGPTLISSTEVNLRAVSVAGGQLYVSTQVNSSFRIGAVGTGTPTTAGQTIANLPGLPASGNPVAFVFADLSPAVAGVDTLYLADEIAGQIKKFTFNGTTWSSSGSTALATVKGLAGTPDPGGFLLLATATTGLYRLLDAGAGLPAPTLIASPAANTSFRGVAFSPALPATHLELAMPSNVAQGVPFDVTVTARDALNRVAPAYRGTVHFTSSDPLASLPANYTFTGSDAGVHTFTNAVTLETAGTQSVTATDTLDASIAGTAATIVDCPPLTVTATNDGPVCEGGTVHLAVTAVAGATYLWSGPNGFTSTERTPSIAGATPAATGTYAVTVNKDGCVNESSTEVTVNAIPGAPVASNGGPYCETDTVQLTASDIIGAIYDWTGPDSFHATVQNPAIPNATVAASGTYFVTATVNGCTSPAGSTTVIVGAAPASLTMTAPLSIAAGATGTAAVGDHAGSSYAWTVSGGSITAGQGTASIEFTATSPGTRITLSVTETNAAGCTSAAASARIMVDFLDVPPSHPLHDFIVTLARNGITGGCGGGNYCPASNVLRSQMAVFLLRGEHGEAYAPPAATGIFADVTVPSFFADFIERLYNEGITGGCASDPLRYCPGNSVLRSQMAIFLLRAEHGASYVPPVATGIFADVPIGSFGANFIEQLYNEGVTGGCATNPLRYCPGDPTNRGAMAVFLTRTFNLQ